MANTAEEFSLFSKYMYKTTRSTELSAQDGHETINSALAVSLFVNFADKTIVIYASISSKKFAHFVKYHVPSLLKCMSFV